MALFSVVLLLWCSAPDLAAAEVAPPPAESYLRSIPPDLLAHLERDRFVVFSGDPATPGLVQGLVEFSQPYPQVWRLLAQTDRQREYRTELTEDTTLERFENGSVDRHRISMLFIRIAYHLRYQLDPGACHIEWSLAPDYENDMQQISGAWDFFDLGANRTLGRLATTVRLGSGMPRSMQDAITRKNLPETLDHVRRWVDSGGTWRAR